MKLKNEYVLLGIVIVALGLYLFLNQQDRVHYTLPETPRLEMEDITRIEIEKAGGKLTLKRTDGKWRLEPAGHPADGGEVERILRSIAELEVTALVSETQSFARYDLDADRRIDVRAFNKDKLVRRFAVGKAAGTFRHTHILVGEDKNVYHAAGSFRWAFDKTAEDLRDKTVLAFDRHTITAIELTAEGQALVVEKQSPATEPADAEKDPPASPPPAEGQSEAPEEPRWLTATGEPVDAATVDQLLSALSPLKCSAYLDEDQPPIEADLRYRLALKGGETKTLDIFGPAVDTESDYTARSSDSPFAFKLSAFDVTKIKDFYTAVTGTGEEPPAPDTPQ